MRIVVADDEAPARRRLIRMLEEIGGLEIVGEAADGAEALRESDRTDPDLLLLDIDMPEVEGLTVAERLQGSTAVVFVTAHAVHAVKAFELDATDYLVKPIRRDRLLEAIRRVRARRSSSGPSGGLDAAGDVGRIVAHCNGTARFFDARRVAHFWALDKYTAFLADGAEQLTDESLSALEDRFAPLGFVRVHRSHLVQRATIRAFRAQHGALELELEGGVSVPVSRRMSRGLRRDLGL